VKVAARVSPAEGGLPLAGDSGFAMRSVATESPSSIRNNRPVDQRAQEQRPFVVVFVAVFHGH
jgi:hypothetical protein